MWPKRKYDVILADPPWKYGDRFATHPGSTLGCVLHYPTMSYSEMADLPVRRLGNRDSVLFLWATSPMLPRAIDLMKAWGYRYRTVAFVWVKLTSTGKYAHALGRWTLPNPVEYVLLGTRGKPNAWREANDRTVRQLVVSERTRHSEKPAEVHERIERMLGPRPRIELFARSRRPGWDAWGNEV